MKLQDIVDTIKIKHAINKINIHAFEKLALPIIKRNFPKSLFNSGYVYVPYVPLQITPTFVDKDFSFKNNILSRYGSKTLNKDFYSSITVL